MTFLNVQPNHSESRTSTSRADIIVAFKRVIKKKARRQATDLHVRRLLCYVQAKDFDGKGVQRSLQQIADRLVLNVSTSRRVIARAVKHFGLLTVIAQRHVPGGQTYNRYTINWKNVDALLSEANHENALVGRNKFQRGSGSPSSTLALENTDLPVRPALPAGSSDLPQSRANPISRMALAAVSTGLTCLRPAGSSDLSCEAKIDILKDRARSNRIHSSFESTRLPSRSAPENTDINSGAAFCFWPKPAQRLSGNSSSVPAGTIDDLPVVSPPVNTPYESLSYTHTNPSGSDLGWILNGSHPDRPINMDILLNHSRPTARNSLLRLALDSHADAPVFYDHPPSPRLDSVFARFARTPRPSASNLTPRRQIPPLTKRLPPQIIRQNYDSASLMLPSRTNRLATTFKRLSPQISRL